jgi:hypothetical protein
MESQFSIGGKSGFFVGALLGVILAVKIYLSSPEEDDEIPILQLISLAAALSAMACGFVGGLATLIASPIRKASLRRFAAVFAATLGGLAVSAVFGMGPNGVATPEFWIPMVGGSFGVLSAITIGSDRFLKVG